MFTDYTIIKLQKNTLKRYEHNLEDGVLFLFNVVNSDVWIGNNSSNDLIKLLDGKKSLKEIYSLLWPLFDEYEYSFFKEKIDKLLQTLIDKNFLEIIQG